LRIDERALRQTRLSQSSPNRPVVQPAKPAKKKVVNGWTAVSPSVTQMQAASLATGMRHSNFLGQCLQNAPLIRLVNERLQNEGQTAVSEKDFNDPEDRALMTIMYQWLDGSSVATIEELWDILDDDALTKRVHFLLSLPQVADAELERLADTLVSSVLDWRLESVKQLLNEVKQSLNEAQSENDADALEIYQQQLRELPLIFLQINKARSAMSASSRRRTNESIR
jgi:hypothetical protein